MASRINYSENSALLFWTGTNMQRCLFNLFQFIQHFLAAKLAKSYLIITKMQTWTNTQQLHPARLDRIIRHARISVFITLVTVGLATHPETESKPTDHV